MIQELRPRAGLFVLRLWCDDGSPQNFNHHRGNAGMEEYVDLLIAPEHQLAAMRELDEWNKQQGKSQVWTIGDDAGRVVVGDAPVAALGHLNQRGIPYETRPRDPRRTMPVFIKMPLF